jgi:hypothetical protein
MKKLTLILSMMIALMGFNANAAMYIVGNAPFGDWEPDAGVEMTYENGIYTYKATISGTVWFVFATQLDADWDTFNANYRIGPTSGPDTVLVGVEHSTQFAHGNDGAYSFYGIGVEYTITFDEVNMKFKIESDVSRGDVNYDTHVDITDVTVLVGYLLTGDAAPTTADCDLNHQVDIEDVTSLITFLLNGTWPATKMVYTIAGVESVFGSNWDPTDENNNMVRGADGVYTWTKTGVALTENFEFKVVGNHDWSVYEWPEGLGNNYVAEVPGEGIYTIDITFNPDAASADRITCTLTKTADIEHVYTVVGTYNLFEADWDLYYPGNEMVKGDDGIYRLNKAGWFQEGADIRFKVVQDHSYAHSWPAEDFQIGVYKTGAFNYEIVFNPYNNDEDKVHVVITEIF